MEGLDDIGRFMFRSGAMSISCAEDLLDRTSAQSANCDQVGLAIQHLMAGTFQLRSSAQFCAMRISSKLKVWLALSEDGHCRSNHEPAEDMEAAAESSQSWYSQQKENLQIIARVFPLIAEIESLQSNWISNRASEIPLISSMAEPAGLRPICRTARNIVSSIGSVWQSEDTMERFSAPAVSDAALIMTRLGLSLDEASYGTYVAEELARLAAILQPTGAFTAEYVDHFVTTRYSLENLTAIIESY